MKIKKVRNFIIAFLTCIPLIANASLNGIHLVCERTSDYSLKEEETLNENYMFIYFKADEYYLKKIKKNSDDKIIDFSLNLFNSGQYYYNEEIIELIDNLIFREKKLKSILNRNTLILKSNFNDKILFEHKCQISNLKDFKKKTKEVINKSKKFWKNKFKDNKI